MTRIQSLFLVQARFVIANNESWLDAIAFYDVQNQPIPLTGITFRAVVRTDRASRATYIGLASPGVFLDLPANTPRGLILTGGEAGNVLAFAADFDTKNRPQAGDYVFDAIGSADGMTRRVVDGTLTLLEGITR